MEIRKFKVKIIIPASVYYKGELLGAIDSTLELFDIQIQLIKESLKSGEEETATVRLRNGKEYVVNPKNHMDNELMSYFQDTEQILYPEQFGLQLVFKNKNFRYWSLPDMIKKYEEKWIDKMYSIEELLDLKEFKEFQQEHNFSAKPVTALESNYNWYVLLFDDDKKVCFEFVDADDDKSYWAIEFNCTP